MYTQGGFTRILHSGKEDDLMEEIPTFIAKPLPKDPDKGSYVVINRPYAFVQWTQQCVSFLLLFARDVSDLIALNPKP